MNKSALFTLSLLGLILFFSCQSHITTEQPERVKNYIHLSHTRTNSNPSMDSLVESIDFTKFDMLWLGGDLAYLSSADDNTMAHIDSIFNVGGTKTLWALGNHDYTNLNRVTQFTNRPPYYSINENKITLIVLDTQDSLSNIVGAQKDFLFGVLDTIKESSHLVILHHKLIWMYNNPLIEHQASSIPNAGIGDCFYCINPNNFNSEIYPKLVGIRKKGVKVLCIAGDIGVKAKEFEYLTTEGIYFLASGINSNKKNNKALLFRHDITNDSLTWNFKLITDLCRLP
jgi:hypothetical protein